MPSNKEPERAQREERMVTLPAAEAVESLIREYGKLVFHTIYAMTGDWELSQDLTQETFLSALRAIDAAREASGPQFHARTWLMRIALNVVRMQPAGYGARMPVDPADVIPEREAVGRALASVPETPRVPLLLSVVGRFSISEIAKILQLREDAVRQRGCVRTENKGIKKKCWATSRPPSSIC